MVLERPGRGPEYPGYPSGRGDEGDIGPTGDEVGRSGQGKSAQGGPERLGLLGLEPKITTVKSERGMGQGHPHHPIGKTREIEEPKGWIKKSRLPIS